MSQYSIKELEKISGIKTHTLRIWEQRYSLFNPKRTETNIRYYDDEDVRLLLQIQVLQSIGYKISKIVNLSDDEKKEILSVATNKSLSQEDTELIYVNRLIESGMEFNEMDFIKTLDEVIVDFGLKNAFKKVFYQTLVRVGLLWEVGDFSPAQEHFTSCLIRNRIIIETAKLKPGNGQTYVLWLPEGEEHEIGLLYINFMLRYFGHQVIYLGARVPFDSLNQVLLNVKPDASYSFIVSRKNLGEFETYKTNINNSFPKLKCYWSGVALNEAGIESNKNHIQINSIEDFFNEVL
jgi:DNA-binding transcriptional MerR regulator